MLKIFLLTKNESYFIDDWIKYHGYLFGLNNIHVLDGSDDKKTLDVYKKFEPLGLNVHYSTAGLNEACDELNKLMHLHKGVDNFLIKLDTDEFITFTDPVNLTSHNYLDRFFRKGSLVSRKKTWHVRKKLSEKITDMIHAQKNLHINNINEKLKSLPVTGRKYKASLTAWSLPTQEAMPRPCYDLTQFTPIQFTQMKSFFHSSNFVSVDLGGHTGITTLNSGAIDTGMTIIHYHSTSVEDAQKRARQALLSHDYFDESDDHLKQKEKLLKARVSENTASFHKIDFYLKYLDSLEGGAKVLPSTLNLYHPHFRPTDAQREIKIIKETLDILDSPKKFDAVFSGDVVDL